MRTLTTILSTMEKATGLKPSPFFVSAEDVPAIVYEYYRTNDDAAVAINRLMVRSVGTTLEEALDLEEKVVGALCTMGDETLGDVLSVEVNGGGSMLDSNTGYPQQITYFQITDRS